jgi:CheY-like chemotaxis protein
MSDDLTKLLSQRRPTAERPLLGLTILTVEDSRFASEAIRLLCLRSGARIRRADSLAAGRRHLAAYRPTVVIADLGLPDGDGAALIGELAAAHPRVPVLLAMSGDPDGAAAAFAAGADGFLDKPLGSLGAFQSAILDRLPDDWRPEGPREVPTGGVDPDRIALRDDLAHAARVLETRAGDDDEVLDYVAQFLGSLARTAGDGGLARAAGSLAESRASGGSAAPALADLETVVQDRLAAAGPI